MFRNEAFTDFTIAANRSAFQSALNEVDQAIRGGKLHAEPIIAGKALTTSAIISAVDPSSNSPIGKVYFAGEPETETALKSVAGGQKAWARTPFTKRAEIIRACGTILRQKRLYLAAIMVREAGKPWKEADADVCEAIDFCDYYADEMLRLGPPQRTQNVMGEDNIYLYQERGVAAVIAPWNFPLAIACGMTCAALVTGNSTILKPSEQTNLIGAELARALLQAGVPADAFAYLPGHGEVVGRKLVNDLRVDVICFTGSKTVGLEIIARGATVAPGQHNIKKVVAEMGGKNAIIVDEDADLDEAVKGVIYSAFGFSGQKCSACSRVIAVGSAYETFVTRLCDAAADILVGPASDSSVLIGPVISEEARDRILASIEAAEKRNKLAFKGKTPAQGFFVPPTIFRDVPTDSPLWKNEIFGPVLACAKAETFDDAIRMAIESEYKLTGGLFSRSPANIAKAREEFRVGNLYVNRGCTGAIVCRQPFGGFGMSGVGSKAGGPDYLLQFLEPRTISENTLRRGFAPELPS